MENVQPPGTPSNDKSYAASEANLPESSTLLPLHGNFHVQAGSERNTPELSTLLPSSGESQAGAEQNPSESSTLLPSSRSSAVLDPGSSPHPKAPKAHYLRRARAPFFTTWAWEGLLVLSAAGTLIAIVSILASYQNQPPPSWKLGINLNTLIALTTMTGRIMHNPR